jgi:PAS domain S-box-containing protein
MPDNNLPKPAGTESEKDPGAQSPRTAGTTSIYAKSLALYQKLPLHSKFVLAYGLAFAFFVFFGAAIAYPLVRRVMFSSMDTSLDNATRAVVASVKGAAENSIKDYLRSATDRNIDICSHFYELQKQGRLTEAQAKARAEEYMLNQHIGKSGYIGVMTTDGIIPFHKNPVFAGASMWKLSPLIASTETRLRTGSMEYRWQNPGDPAPRQKTQYFETFEPWKWIVAATAYQDELSTFLNTDDFRREVLSMRIGNRGYGFVLDPRGTVIVHPYLKSGVNYYAMRSPGGTPIVKIICTLKKGRISYDWRNPDEPRVMDHMAVFDYIPELDWIVVATTYTDDIYHPLNMLGYVFLAVWLLIGLSILLLTRAFSSFILRNMALLLGAFSRAEQRDLAARLPVSGDHDFGLLFRGFNSSMERLETYQASLHHEIENRRSAEAAMRAANSKYAALLRGTTEFSVIVCDLEYRIQVVSEGAKRMLGYTEEELAGQNLLEVVHDPAELQARSAEQNLQSGDPITAPLRSAESSTREWTYITKTGKRIPVVLSVSKWYGDEGKAMGYIGIAMDLTARKKAETAQRAAHERFASIMRAADSFCIIGTDMERRIDIFNEGAQRLLGYSEEEMLGRNVTEAIHDPDEMKNVDLAQWSKTVADLAARHRAHYREWTLITKNGERLTMQLSVTLRFNSAGTPEGYLAIGVDITELKRAEEDLRIANEKYSDILRAATEFSIISTDNKGNIQFFNEGAQLLLGYTAKEAMGKNILELVHDPEELRNLARKTGAVPSYIIGKLADNSRFYTMESVYIRKDNRKVDVQITITARRDGKGDIIGYLSISADITERKKAERELRDSEQKYRLLSQELEERVRQRTAELEASMKELDSFTYSVSHDLKTPLRAIDGFARVIEEDYAAALPPDALGYFHRMADSAQHMGRLIEDLLNLSRLDRKSMVFEPVDMQELLQTCLRETKPLCENRDIKFRIGTLPPARGDAALLREVFANLIGNAVKYTRKTEAATVEIDSFEKEGETVYFVRDNGAGFNMEYAGMLFKPFSRLHHAREFEGTGVGLNIVYRIITRHGGRVWAEGAEGKGAAVYFTLCAPHIPPAPAA